MKVQKQPIFLMTTKMVVTAGEIIMIIIEEEGAEGVVEVEEEEEVEIETIILEEEVEIWIIKEKKIIQIPENAFEELFIKGINYEATEDDLNDTFNKYGAISSCKILKDKETKKSKGCGFVKFEDKISAVRALNDADNLVCKGRNLLVRFANDKEGELKGKKKGKSGFNQNNESNNDENRGNGERGGRGRGGERGRGRGGFRGNDRGRGDRGGTSITQVVIIMIMAGAPLIIEQEVEALKKIMDGKISMLKSIMIFYF